MMKTRKGALALFLALLVMPQARACFTVYNVASNQVVYSGIEPPIDMSYQIHERLPAAFPASHMVFDSSTDCPSLDARKRSPELSNVPRVSPAVTARPARPYAAISRAARRRVR